MDGLELLTEARTAGLEVRAEGDRLVIRGPRRAEALAKRLLDNKAELLALLQEAQEAIPEGTPPSGYLTGRVAIDEGARQMESLGWMPIWAEALGEPIILVMDEKAARKAPAVYPVYTVEEMRTMANLTPDEQRKLHEAKKLFGGKIHKTLKGVPGQWEEKGDVGSAVRLDAGLRGGPGGNGGADPEKRDPPGDAGGAPGSLAGGCNLDEHSPGGLEDLQGKDLVGTGSPGVGDPGLRGGGE